MSTSPDIANYYIGKGNCYFTPTGGAEVHMGNCPSWVITPSITNSDHFSSMTGTKSKDRTILISKDLKIDLELEEFTIANLKLALLGSDASTTSAGGFSIGTSSGATGALRFTGANDVGSQFEVLLPSVQVNPSNGVDFISADIASVKLSFNINAVAGSFGTVAESADGTA